MRRRCSHLDGPTNCSFVTLLRALAFNTNAHHSPDLPSPRTESQLPEFLLVVLIKTCDWLEMCSGYRWMLL